MKSLAENDWVIPAQPLMGTWRTMAVWKEKNLISVGKEVMPLEYMATLTEMCLAYRLLEDYGKLKVCNSCLCKSEIKFLLEAVGHL